MKQSKEIVELKLDNEATVLVEAINTNLEYSGRKKISDEITEKKFSDFTNSVAIIASETIKPLSKIDAKKFTIKMGMNIGLKSGKLTALLVEGSAKANIEITIEWSNENKQG